MLLIEISLLAAVPRWRLRQQHHAWLNGTYGGAEPAETSAARANEARWLGGLYSDES